MMPIIEISLPKIDLFMEKANHQWIENALFASWWMEWEDLSWPDPSLTEKWRRRAAIFKDTGVNAVVIFGFHFRWDYLPVIDRVLGCLNEVTAICKEFELRVVDHFSISLTHRPRNLEERRDIMARNFHHVPFYPDNWDLCQFGGVELKNCRQVSAYTGQPVYYPNYTSEIFCYNNPRYREALGKFIKKHVETLPVDALMADDVHFFPGMESCVCTYCLNKFKDETDFDLLKTIGDGFWDKAPDDLYHAWIQFRYRSNDEFYGQVREMLPAKIALWGCTSTCTHPRCPEIGFATERFVRHFDAVMMELYHGNSFENQSATIISDFATFGSLAEHYGIPLIALCYPSTQKDYERYMGLCSEFNARPWVSKQPRDRNAVKEEEFLQSFPLTDFGGNRNQNADKVPVLRFSHCERDAIRNAEKREQYVTHFMEGCRKHYEEFGAFRVIFDDEALGAGTTQLPLARK